jgi:hypothetical protein
MVVLKHKVFKAEPSPRFFRGLAGTPRSYGVRGRVEEFAEGIGSENVVSIVEHMEPCFTIVVWYREEPAAKAKLAPADEFFEAPSYH